MTDAAPYMEKAEGLALGGLDESQKETARLWLRDIVAGWLRSAEQDASVNRDRLVETGLRRLEESLAGKQGAERLAALQALALRPRVDRVSGQAFELATRVADGKLTRQRAERQATELRDAALGLMSEVRQLRDPAARQSQMRSLADAELDTRYVLEADEGAISLRLNQHING